MKIIAKSTLHIARHIVYVRPSLQAPRWGARAPLSRPRAGYALQTILAEKRPAGARARRYRDRAQGKPPNTLPGFPQTPFPLHAAPLRSVLRAVALRRPRHAPTPPCIILPCRMARPLELESILFGLHLPLGLLRRLGVGAGTAAGAAIRAGCLLPSARHPYPA